METTTEEEVNILLFARVQTVSNFLESGQFNFMVKDEAGTVISSTGEIAKLESDTSGIVELPSINFTDAGVFNFTIEQIAEQASDWKTDTRKYPVLITINQQRDGSF